MDIKQLIYFLTIAEEGNISKAAERLHMAQPPLSQQLKLLEEELGVILFQRNTRRMQITDAGQLLQSRAQQIIELMEKTSKELNDLKEGSQGVLSIGTISSAGETLVPIVVQDFHKAYPGVDFRIKESSTFEILELVKRGVVEVGVIRTPFNLETFDHISLPEEPMMAAAMDSLLDMNKTSMNLDELKDKPLLFHNRYANNIEEACRKSGFEPKVKCRIDDTRTMLNWASSGMGIALIPRDMMTLIPDSNLRFIEIKDQTLATKIIIIWKKNHYLSTPARHFLEFFKSKKLI
ncbi:LysR family transcriptional regulator (plasmid) [Priestia megaterium]|jgi:DNA-binding transcriptional LysR family regulator|uniref:LysR family transcriptional regulator n=1 Tax=Priestia TaxID=2800373 RepID=UPI000BEB40F7|nr:LysR family transcriptional regulator [Priestia megaterium]MDH2449719.1 LysR family transcriptional regulator [Priestia megaterium]MDL5149177.1 LysR family transcriptional regulator [Priestia megaterium]MED4619184.1 LysR family transcriptional regulator [Priestia megaterium]PEB61277.1 LysR family transcriptional regulator [Priestia megaterium]PEE77691.1 LysR family transcriptional regulator [Priestia megaterium]